eukprot:165218_1
MRQSLPSNIRKRRYKEIEDYENSKKKKKHNPDEILGICTYQTKDDMIHALKNLVSSKPWTNIYCLELKIDYAAFNSLFGEMTTNITPKNCNENTASIICTLNNKDIENIFGKIQTFTKMDIVFFPPQHSARIWFVSNHFNDNIDV